ncbi:MAG: hypothetical protein C0404_10290 [Verrucomicrobia bacterium]|nr:hypothetical protein [Verrucomicrobiota bacterium]
MCVARSALCRIVPLRLGPDACSAKLVPVLRPEEWLSWSVQGRGAKGLAPSNCDRLFMEGANPLAPLIRRALPGVCGIQVPKVIGATAFLCSTKDRLTI